MGDKKITKKEVKSKMVEIFEIENRPVNIREITNILKDKFKIIRSQPVIRNYLDELVEEKELKLKT